MKQISLPSVKELYFLPERQDIFLEESTWQNRHFYTFYLPFLCWAKDHMSHYDLWNVYMTQKAETDFLTGLMNRLEAICLRTLVVEIRYCRAGGMLGNGDSAEQYEQFVEGYLRDREQMVSFWESYAYLYEIVTQEAGRYVEFFKQILCHLQQDLVEIESCLGAEKGFRRITDLRMDRGDIHGDGKSVAELTLDSEVCLYYKPGNKKLKACFMNALNELYCEQGLSVWHYQAVLKEDHTWEAAVSSEKCHTREERFRYYRRLGIALFLCYQWRICDIHCENVISHGEFPVLIDVEVVKRQAAGRSVKWGLLNISVLSVGILPCYTRGAGENRVNPGVLCLDEHQKSAVRHLVMKNPKTADICLELEYTELNLTNDIPKWIAEEEREVTDCICEGFGMAGRCYQSRSDQDRMAEICRYIHRPTNEYAMLFFMLRHPKYLSGREEAENMLQTALARPGNGGVKNPEVVKWETEFLLRGEIPLFTFREDSRRLYCGEKFVEDFFVDRPEHDSKEENFPGGRMSEKNLLIQKELIAVSMAGLLQDPSGYLNDYGQKNLDAYLYSVSASGDFCRQAAEKVVRRIADLAFCEGDQIDWWSVELQFRDKVLWDVVEMSPWIYQGKAGVALFLHKVLNRGLSDSEEITEMIGQLDRMLFRYTDQLLPKAGEGVYGAMSGEYSIVYYYQYIYGLTGEKQYLDYARRHLEKISGKEPSESYDLLYGAGGMALVWLNQWELTGENCCLAHAEEMLGRLEILVGQETAKGRSEILPGMAHGWSGVLLAFQRYELLTGSRRYDNVMKRIFYEENKWYRPEMNNWEDIHRGAPMDTVAWCHGAAGILLCRMELMKNRNREIASAAERDVKRAAAKIRSMPLRKGYCLCHGNLGNISILRKYARITGDRDLEKLCAEYIQIAAEQFYNNTLKLLPQEKYDFGFMNGLCGIGAAFLDDEEFVTDILTLQIRKR